MSVFDFIFHFPLVLRDFAIRIDILLQYRADPNQLLVCLLADDQFAVDLSFNLIFFLV
jgi:hypothetical protein